MEQMKIEQVNLTCPRLNNRSKDKDNPRGWHDSNKVPQEIGKLDIANHGDIGMARSKSVSLILSVMEIQAINDHLFD